MALALFPVLQSRPRAAACGCWAGLVNFRFLPVLPARCGCVSVLPDRGCFVPVLPDHFVCVTGLPALC